MRDFLGALQPIHWICLAMILAFSLLAVGLWVAEQDARMRELTDLSRPVPRHAQWTMEGGTERLSPPPPPPTEPLDPGDVRPLRWVRHFDR